MPGVPPSRHAAEGPGAQRQSCPEGRGWAPHPSPLGPPALSTRRPSPSPGCLHPAPIPARSFPTMSSPSAKSHPSSVSPAAAPAAGPGRRGQSSRRGGEGEQGQEAAGQPWPDAPGQGAQAAPLFRTLPQLLQKGRRCEAASRTPCSPLFSQGCHSAGHKQRLCHQQGVFSPPAASSYQRRLYKRSPQSRSRPSGSAVHRPTH